MGYDQLIINLKVPVMALTVIFLTILLLSRKTYARGRRSMLTFYLFTIFLSLIAIILGYDLFILGELNG